MKKIILIMALAVSAFSFAQDKMGEVKRDTVSGGKTDSSGITISITAANLGFYGVSIELPNDRVSSDILNLDYSSMTVSHQGVDHKGVGFQVEHGWKFYLGRKANEKLYVEELFSFARLDFNDANYHGVYKYIAPINASLGYKFVLGQHLVIDPSVGVLWKIEIKPTGNLDNKDFDNWLFKAGVKVGYRF